MKFGSQFARESVPRWSIHNIDYNSLKHHIKVNTTRDQATAIAIPGRGNTALSKFEDDFYGELCQQYDRVDLFVKGKTGELERRLQHVSSQIRRLMLRCATSQREALPFKRRQRFAKYEQTLLECGNDIKSLQRFVGAQAVAFRKLLKKYRKWTGSSALGARFKENVLAHPKSFTQRNFSQLEAQYNDLLETLRGALPPNADLQIALPPSSTDAATSRPASTQLSPSETIVAPPSQVSAHYWNEYDNGSEAGDFDRSGDSGYAIYVDPNASIDFPGMKFIGALLAKPMAKLPAWLSPFPKDADADADAYDDDDLERGPLLPTTHSTASPYGSTTTRTPAGAEPSYFSSPPGRSNIASELDADNDLASSHFPSTRPSRRNSASYHPHHPRDRGYTSSSISDDQLPSAFPAGYAAHYADYTLPSIGDQRVARYRERVLVWGTWACFAAAAVLMAVAGVLIATGRHRMRLEVDAGVTLGIVASLGLACAGLVMTGSKRDRVSVLGRVAVWSAFVGCCVVNGVLLVLVVGNSSLGGGGRVPVVGMGV